ncbi:MAG: hypothetical protein ACJ74Z_14270 [Bryobacteraceae bacterium]
MSIELSRRSFLVAGAGLGAKMLSAQGTPMADIRLIVLAPSPYTHRMDSIRAGYGIKTLLEAHIQQLGLPFTVGFYDGVKRLDDVTSLPELFSNSPRVILMGSSVWGQGSNRYIRQLFEILPQQSIIGTQASSWVTAGGAHTGGEVVAQDTQRSLMGIGASVFNLGQKLVVFTTEERDDIPFGEFTLLDVWIMDQFAQLSILQALQRRGPGLPSAQKVQSILGFQIDYFARFPLSPADFTNEIRRLRLFLNRAINPSSAERMEIVSSLT